MTTLYIDRKNTELKSETGVLGGCLRTRVETKMPEIL